MPTISKDVWITREGREIEIKNMASSHLLSTIHFIERQRFTNSVECARRIAAEPGDDSDFSLQYYMQWPLQYETLIAEAQRRHLLYRQVEGLVKS